MIITLEREERRALLTIRWKGGAITELALTLPKPQPAIRTDEDAIALIGRLAAHYDDGRIAGIPNRQGRRSATGERFTAIIVGGLRRYRQIPAYKPPAEPPDGELLPVGKAADELGVAASTIFRWLQAGFIRGEQDTPGAPWRIRRSMRAITRRLYEQGVPTPTGRPVWSSSTLGGMLRNRSYMGTAEWFRHETVAPPAPGKSHGRQTRRPKEDLVRVAVPAIITESNRLRQRVTNFAKQAADGIDSLNFDQRQRLLRLIVEQVRVQGWQVELRLRIPLDQAPEAHPKHAAADHPAAACSVKTVCVRLVQFARPVFPSPDTPGWIRSALGFPPSSAPRDYSRRTPGRGHGLSTTAPKPALRRQPNLQFAGLLDACDLVSHS